MKGYVYDALSGDPLPFANVFFSFKNGDTKEPVIGTITDENGFYSFGENCGGFTISASFTGYKMLTITRTDACSAEAHVDFALEPSSSILPGVEIVGDMVKKATTSVKENGINWLMAGLVTTFGAGLAGVLIYKFNKNRKKKL